MEINTATAEAPKWISLLQFVKADAEDKHHVTETPEVGRKKKHGHSSHHGKDKTELITYPYNKANLHDIEYFKQLLHLFTQLCVVRASLCAVCDFPISSESHGY